MYSCGLPAIQVLVEAAYNPNMPFKWNATPVQVLPNQVSLFALDRTI